jgi:WD40 repeat protein
MSDFAVNSDSEDAGRIRGRQIRSLFDRAIQESASQRDGFLEASGADLEIQDEVRSLLEFIDVTMVTPEEPVDASSGIESPRSLVGCRVGDFELLRLVGTGGTSVIFEAKQTRPDRVVAVKVLRTAFSGPRARRRFEREVEITGQFEHPSIARVFASGSMDVAGRHTPWLAMDFVVGALPISQFVKAENLDVRATVHLFREAVSAIRYAHGRGVIHRDLKPANILVGSDGAVRVIDFGIARLDDAKRRPDTLDTVPGQVLGTVPFMAPEQIDGGLESIDVRTDEYALGVVAFLLFTGRMPYELGDCGIVEAATRIREAIPSSLRIHNSSIDRDLDGIIQKSLEKSPDARYQSIEAMDADLEAWLEHRPVTARPLGRVARFARMTRSNPMTASMIGLAVGFLIVALFVLTVMLQRESALLRLSQRSAADAQLASAISAHAAGDMASLRLRLAEIPPSERGWEYGWLERQIDRSDWTISGFRGDVLSIDLVDAPATGEEWILVSDYEGVSAHRLSDGREQWINEWTSPSTGWRHCVVPDRNLVLSVDLQAHIRLIDLQTGETLVTRAVPEPIGEVAAFPEEGIAILAGEEGTVYAIDLATLEIQKSLATESRLIRTVAALPGNRVLLGTEEGVVFETTTDLEHLKPVLHRDGVVLRFEVSEDAGLVAVCGGDGITEVLDFDTWKIVHRLRGNKSGVWDAMFDDVNNLLHTVGTDDSIRTFDLISGEQIGMIGSSQGYIWSGALGEDGRSVWSGGHDGTVKKWLIRPTDVKLPGDAIPGPAVFSPSGGHIAIGDEDKNVHIFELQTESWIDSFEVPEIAVGLYWPTSDGLFIGMNGAGVLRIDPATGARRSILDSGIVASFDDHPDGGFLAGIDDGRVARIAIDGTIEAMENPGRPESMSTAPRAMRISTNALRRQVAIVGGERSASVQVFNLDDWSQVEGIPRTILNYEFEVDFAPSGNELVLAGRERPENVVALDLDRMEYSTKISGHQGNALFVKYIDQGDRIVSAGQDGAIFISRPGDSRPLAKVLQVIGAVRGLAVSPNEHGIAVTHENGVHLIRGGVAAD